MLGGFRLSRVPGYHKTQHSVYSTLDDGDRVNMHNVVEIIFRPATEAESRMLALGENTPDPLYMIPEHHPPTILNSPEHFYIPATPETPTNSPVRPPASKPIDIPTAPPHPVRRRLYRTCQYCRITSICFPATANCGNCLLILCSNCVRLPNYACQGTCSPTIKKIPRKF